MLNCRCKVLLTRRINASLRDNVAAYDRYRILPRALRNVSDLDISTTMFNCRVRSWYLQK